MKPLTLTLLLCVLLTGVAAMQAPAPEAYSETEQLRIQNANLLVMLRDALHESDTCRGTLAEPRFKLNTDQVTEALRKLEGDINAHHPCCTWDAQTGTFTPKPVPK